MLDQWKAFLLTNQNAIFEAYSDALFPRLAGFILYHVHHSESFSQIDQVEFYESATQNDKESSLRSVSTHRHGDMSIYFYARRSLNPSDFVASWLTMYQFEKHTGHGDWNIPCTWGEIVGEWVRTNRDFKTMGKILEPMVDPALANDIYCRDGDEGYLGDLMVFYEESLLETAAKFTIGALDEAYPWFYRSHRTVVEKEAYKEKIRRAKIKDREAKMRVLAMKLLPEFHRRLRTNLGLIVPQLRFAKDLDIWPFLLQTLKTFSPQEQAAIVFVSNCSNSIRAEFTKAN